MTKFYLLPALLMMSVSSPAQTEFFDTSFANQGVACVPNVWAATVMGDFVRVADDFYALSSFSDYSVMKFDLNGNQDLAFGTDGVYYMNLYTSGGALYDATNSFIRLTPDNKLLVVGDKGYPVVLPRNFMSLRNLDGSPVTTFGQNGFVSAAVAPESIDFAAVDVDESKITLVGDSFSTATLDILRFGLDGLPMDGFGTDGVLRFAYDDTNYDVMHAFYHRQTDQVYVLYTKAAGSQMLPYFERYDLSTQSVDLTLGTLD